MKIPTVDAICNGTPNKNVYSQIEKYSNISLNIINNNIDIIEYIKNSKSDFVLFIDKKDKLDKYYFDIMLNSLKCISLVPNNEHSLELNGKFIPTIYLKDHIRIRNIKEYNSKEFYFLTYCMPKKVINNIKYIPSYSYSFKECSKDLMDTIESLDNLKLFLEKENLYFEEKFKQYYIDEIVRKYSNYYNSFSFSSKRANIDYVMLVALYIKIYTMFSETVSFINRLEKENLDIELDILKNNKFSIMTKTPKNKMKKLVNQFINQIK